MQLLLDSGVRVNSQAINPDLLSGVEPGHEKSLLTAGDPLEGRLKQRICLLLE